MAREAGLQVTLRGRGFIFITWNSTDELLVGGEAVSEGVFTAAGLS